METQTLLRVSLVPLLPRITAIFQKTLEPLYQKNYQLSSSRYCSQNVCMWKIKIMTEMGNKKYKREKAIVKEEQYDRKYF